jgi:hypothetical protein
MPKSNHYILKYGDWKFGQGKGFRPHPTLTPIRISNPQGKMKVHKCVCADATSIRTDAKTKKQFYLFLFFSFLPHSCGQDQRPRGRTHVSARTGKIFKKKLF